MSFIDFIRKLLGKKPSVDSISKKSSEILNVFTKTQKRCDDLIKEITVSVSSKRELAKKILEEAQEMDSIATKNDNLSKKIESFINS